MASAHSVRTEYEWTRESDTIGVSSPVLYVTRPGVYQCIITGEKEKTSVSHNIEVVAGLLTIIIGWSMIQTQWQ